MLTIERARDIARWGSTLLISVAGAVTAHFVQTGMNATGWAGAALTLTASFALAATLRTWAEQAPA